jgi:deoxyribodipyrimidine photo-lyase
MTRAVHWFRNDLRLRDNSALIAAAEACDELILLFVLDERILASPATGAPRVRFLLDCLRSLARALEERGQRLVVRRGDPAQVVPRVLEESRATLLSFNRDRTPYAQRRDRRITTLARRAGARVYECKDRVVFESAEVLSQQGRTYAIYTPYRRSWRRLFEEIGSVPRPTPRLPGCGVALPSEPLPDAGELGFEDDAAEVPAGGEAAAQRGLRAFLEERVAHYHRERDHPAVDGTSRLSPYLRFGAISVRDCLHEAREAGAADARLERGVAKWMDEVVWREFYAAILEEHPRVAREPYRAEFKDVKWELDETGFRAWCSGRTGYPFVDAGMRQLAASGWMHNRVRMVAASFLTKDLLIDWRRGERFFFQRLVDGDPASNNGGWQWSASTGTDAAPYFRIFNPISQGKRYDPDGDYVRRWVPELRHLGADEIHEPWLCDVPPRGYPEPIVDHAERRLVALERYQQALRDAGRQSDARAR